MKLLPQKKQDLLFRTAGILLFLFVFGYVIFTMNFLAEKLRLTTVQELKSPRQIATFDFAPFEKLFGGKLKPPRLP